MNTLAKRLKHAREIAGVSQATLAKQIGSGQSTIGSIENGRNQGSGKLLQIARVLNVNPEWLETGRGPMQPQAEVTIDALNANTSPGPEVRGHVPLISSVQAGEWSDLAVVFREQDAEMWLPCPVRHGPLTFCLRVEGESMKNPIGRPSYDPGDIIFVDPGLCANPGDRVVAKLDDQEKTTFKQYMEEDGRKLLKALNPDWKPRYLEINGNASICGVVIGKWVAE